MVEVAVGRDCTVATENVVTERPPEVLVGVGGGATSGLVVH